jgi:uncharacterized protein with von Willebrand factor type A (vWA) domain
VREGPRSEPAGPAAAGGAAEADGLGAGEGGLRVGAALSRLTALMRAGGVPVGVGDLLAAHRALAAVDATSREEAFYALRAALCASHADLAVFAEAFALAFAAPEEEREDPLEQLGMIERAALPRLGIPAETATDVQAGEVPAPAAWSDEELLHERDFALYTDAERAVARRLLGRLARRAPQRISRRTRPTRRRRDVHDLRATVRLSLRHGGEFVERRYRAPAWRPRRLVLVCDVSGSMAPYARMLLMYLQASVAARARVEAFVFGTRLTRVTRELAGRDPDRALQRAADAVHDWSGGTRIGDAIAELNRVHGRRIGRGALVVILSDGWDRGDPELLAAEMARLRRCSHRVVWLNPLAADPRYEPLTRGMQAALPHVDHLIPGNSLASLETLAALMEEGVPA